MRIYLVRHGETELNRKGCYYGQTDIPLSACGRQQAGKLGRFFRDIPLQSSVISPLIRAAETAEIIMAEYTNEIKIYRDDRLAEQNFGIFEGQTYQELTKKYPQEWADWNRDFSGYRIPGGESFLDVRKRTESFFFDLKKMSEKEDREFSVLLVAHKGTLGHLLAVSLGLPPEGYWNFVFEQGCYSRLDLEDGYAIIRCLNQSVDGDLGD